MKGLYFVTIVTKNRVQWFGKICEDELILNEYGEFTRRCWLEIANHFEKIRIDEFVIMPNHIHGIIEIDAFVGAADLRPLRDRTKMYLPKVIQGFKAAVTKRIRRVFNNYEFSWQRSYYDRIIRDQNEYRKIKNYIIRNPENWNQDKLL